MSAAGTLRQTRSDSCGPEAAAYAIGREPTRTSRAIVGETERTEVAKTVQVNQGNNPIQTATYHVRVGEYFKAIKNWEGVVEAVNEKSFVATMREADSSIDRGDEQFEIDLADVEAGDLKLVEPGAIFYFTVGYRIVRGGTRIKGAQIVFRRMPRWSRKDIQRVDERAKKLLEIMGGEGEFERGAKP